MCIKESRKKGKDMFNLPENIGDYWWIPDDYYPEVTWDNSPQKLVLSNEKQ